MIQIMAELAHTNQYASKVYTRTRRPGVAACDEQHMDGAHNWVSSQDGNPTQKCHVRQTCHVITIFTPLWCNYGKFGTNYISIDMTFIMIIFIINYSCKIQ